MSFTIFRSLKGFKQALARRTRPAWLFTRAMLANPTSVGALCPSSKKLSRCIAKQVPIRSGLVVELGAGTGVVTQALLNRGIDASRIIAIERSEKLASYLNKYFPEVHVIQGDAVNLKQLLGERIEHVHSVVSSLPLLSLPKQTVRSIGQQLNYLPNNSLFIQFTYGQRRNFLHLSRRLKKLSSQSVWGNLPPARVDVYQLQQNDESISRSEQ